MYIYGSFRASASGANALVVGPYQLQSTATPPDYFTNVLLGVVGPSSFDTETLQVATLSVKTKRTRPNKHAHNQMEVDTWAFKGVANFTADPSIPVTIPADGVVIELSNSAEAILDTVAFAPTECKLMRKCHRILCKHKGGSSRLMLTQRKQKQKVSSSGLPIWQLSGRFSKQDIVGDITATPLNVALNIDIPYVDRQVGADSDVWCADTRPICFHAGH